MSDLEPRGPVKLNHTQKLVAMCLVAGMKPEQIEEDTNGAVTARHVYRLKKNPAVIEYMERCESGLFDKLTTARVKVENVLMESAEKAAQIIADLASNATNQETQRKAAIDVLTLAGLKAPEKVDVSVMPHLQVVFDDDEVLPSAPVMAGFDEEDEDQ